MRAEVASRHIMGASWMIFFMAILTHKTLERAEKDPSHLVLTFFTTPTTSELIFWVIIFCGFLYFLGGFFKFASILDKKSSFRPIYPSALCFCYVIDCLGWRVSISLTRLSKKSRAIKNIGFLSTVKVRYKWSESKVYCARLKLW